MKYFSIYVPDAQSNRDAASKAKQEAMQQFVAGAAARGEFLSGGGFLSLSREGVVARRKDGNTVVIDGPYVESKELIGGFAMLRYDSREAAIEGAKQFLAVAGDGECITYAIAEGHA